uniref:hypothetical protein n=1 Tax=Klebsiella aerogenes TaxID=548 RepID=UPI001954CB2A
AYTLSSIALAMGSVTGNYLMEVELPEGQYQFMGLGRRQGQLRHHKPDTWREHTDRPEAEAARVSD